MRWAIAACAVGLLLALSASTSSAQPDTPAAARLLLPGVYRVALAEPLVPTTVGIFAGAGYGFNGAVLSDSDSHHRASSSLVAGIALRPWLALALRLDSRYDHHTGLPASEPTDYGWTGDPRLLARLVRTLAPTWHAAGQVTLWIPPGDSFPSIKPSATTIDVLASLSHSAPGSRLRLAINTGFRLDNSANAVPDNYVAQYTAADRLGLGASDAHALLLGAGASYGLGRAELLAEWTWDLLLVGSGPDQLSRANSPMRLAAGVRVPIGSQLIAQALIEVNTAEQLNIAMVEALAPFEPRLSVVAGLHYSVGQPAPRPASRPTVPPLVQQPPPPEPPAAKPATVRGLVRPAGGGAGIAGATVQATTGSGPDSQDTTSRELTADADGRFALTDLPAGDLVLEARADGYEPATLTISLAQGEERELELSLEPTLPPGQLRGLVRSYRGKPVQATLTIEPTGPETTAAEDGSFELDLAPGTYEVVIRAEGYRDQRRQVVIEEGGVTILNIDLRRDRSKRD